MRRYSEPVQVRSSVVAEPGPDPIGPGESAVGEDGTDPGATGDILLATKPVSSPVSRPVSGPVAAPEAFIWQGRLYVVRRILDHWRERRSWWRDALDPVPGHPTGIAVASREQHVWRVEASRGLAHGTGVFDLSSDGAPGAEADWRLVGVSD